MENPIAAKMAKAIKELLGTSIFRVGYTNRTSEAYNKARTGISDALNDYEMSLNSPAPTDWAQELQHIDAMRLKVIREIEALVGDECEILLPTKVYGFKYVGKSQGTVKLHNTGPGEYIRTLSTELLITLVIELQKAIATTNG